MQGGAEVKILRRHDRSDVDRFYCLRTLPQLLTRYSLRQGLEAQRRLPCFKDSSSDTLYALEQHRGFPMQGIRQA